MDSRIGRLRPFSNLRHHRPVRLVPEQFDKDLAYWVMRLTYERPGAEKNTSSGSGVTRSTVIISEMLTPAAPSDPRQVQVAVYELTHQARTLRGALSAPAIEALRKASQDVWAIRGGSRCSRAVAQYSYNRASASGSTASSIARSRVGAVVGRPAGLEADQRPHDPLPVQRQQQCRPARGRPGSVRAIRAPPARSPPCGSPRSTAIRERGQ